MRASAAKAPPGFFGVNSPRLEPGDIARMRAANVGALRNLFHFAEAKSAPNLPYSWQRFDALVGEAAMNEIDLIPVLYGTPPWISTERSAVPLGSTEVVTEWREYLGALADRYGPDGGYWASNPQVPYRPIGTWQIWNEPNSSTWWGPRPRPNEYGVLLRRSAAAIHAVDPSAKILTAGIVARPTNAHAIPGEVFVKRLFDHRGTQAAADVLAFHPYAASAQAVGRQLVGVRGTLRASGTRLPIWVTEIGWGSVGPIEHPLIKSEERQVRTLRSVFKMTLRLRNRVWIRRVLWYQWRDETNDGLCQWCRSSGLLDAGSQPKRIHGVFSRIASS